jgi:ABC-type transport system substrate-binding protein
VRAAAGATGAVVSACAPAPQNSSAPTAAPTSVIATSKPEAHPQPGGSLRAAMQTDIPNVDPIFTSPSNYDALWVAFDRLIALDSNSKPQPMLAESRDASSDFSQIKLNLRKGVQFQSGREFTSDDVKYNMLFVRDPKVGSKLEIHYTPKHGSWLDMAETELSVLTRQCLDRRIPDQDTLISEVTSRMHDCNVKQTDIDWRFTTADARIKLKRLYPAILP